MRILLLSPPFKKEYMRNARCDFVSLSATQWYPILLGYCGSYLQGKGHSIRFVDAPAHYLDHEATRKIVHGFNPELLVLYTGSMSEENDLEFADSLLDAVPCDTVIVGPYASINPEKTLARSRFVGKLVVGEFEIAVGEIADRVNPENIKNLVYKEGQTIIRNPMRDYMTGEELDEIPFVSRFFRDNVDINRYKTPSELYPYIDIMTGRGCAWGMCTYCLWVNTFIKGKRYNVRSMENVIEEFRFIAEEMPWIRSVMIQDDTFTEDRAREFCEAKLSAGIQLPWSCYVKADMNSDVLVLMKQAGCRNLHVGYESGSEKVLKKIRKGITLEQMETFTKRANDAGLRIHGDFAFGFPEETPEDAMKTIELACKLKPHTAQFQLMIPFAGTPYYKEMTENGWLNEDGQPDMPQFTNEQIRKMAKKAYRKFYFSGHYLALCMRHPGEHIFGRLKTIRRAIPAIFWKRWNV
ncbi:MAG: B12-binding domain-containing radical SAM protein [Proteobacteria bacterium]|nr:B12-binding domain-containing radical SAM protein [Pseudomonadota bacterium]